MKTLVIASLLVLSAPQPLRYKYVPGQQRAFQIVEETEIFGQAGSSPERLITKQTTKLTEKMKILSFSNGQAVLEARQVDGQTASTTPTGVSQSIRPPTLRLITMTTSGKILKVERKAIPGVKDASGAFLEGFSLPFPDKPLQPGMSWSGASTARGLDGQPITVKYVATYKADESKAGHRCARISSVINSTFQTKSGSKSAACTLTGTIANWFAPDIGIDISVETDIQLAIAAQGEAKTVQRSRLVSHGKQTLAK